LAYYYYYFYYDDNNDDVDYYFDHSYDYFDYVNEYNTSIKVIINATVLVAVVFVIAVVVTLERPFHKTPRSDNIEVNVN